jgi:group I intron endonuclease
MCDHLWQNGSLSNSHLQAAIALYGLENFEYFVIEFVTEKELLIKVEQKYLDMVPSNQRYNFSPTAGSCLGVVRSAETKAAISNAIKGTTRSAETKAVISEAIKGNTNNNGTTLSLPVYVYDSNNVLVDSFPSYTAAAKFLGCSQPNVSKLIRSGGITKKGYRVYSSPLSK